MRVREPFANKLTALLADLPNAFPTAMGFRCYHIKHHSHLSAYDYDADIPSRWEAEWVGGSTWRKAVWLFFFPAVQLARLSRLKGTVPIMGLWTYVNIAVIAAFDAFVLWAFGPNALLYLFLSFWFSVGGLHPLSARWIQEHFAFGPNQGTFDYYGPLNTLALNIGYHNEHHDFHEIPWTRLPELAESRRSSTSRSAAIAPGWRCSSPSSSIRAIRSRPAPRMWSARARRRRSPFLQNRPDSDRP